MPSAYVWQYLRHNWLYSAGLTFAVTVVHPGGRSTAFARIAARCPAVT